MRIFNISALLAFLAVVGPGVITSAANNDAPGITTYSVTGAHYGYTLIWVLIPTVIVLVIIQEMCARMGVVTRKGLSDLIRKKFGIRATIFIMCALLIANFGTTIAEFLGIAASAEIFGVSRYIAVPLAALAVWFIIVKGNYKRVEKTFLIAVLFYITYVLSGILANPDWNQVGAALARPQMPLESTVIILVIAIIATTIAPWQQFYLQGSMVEKAPPLEKFRYVRAEIILGGIIVGVIAFFVVLANAATLYAAGIQIEDAADAAIALRPLAGEFASSLFAFGLLVSSFLAAAVLPLATAYFISEGFGWERGIDRKFKEAPKFYWLLTLTIAISAAVVLIPGLPFVPVMILSQVAGGIVLPFILICILLIINDKQLMGKYVNRGWLNAIGWAAAAVLISLTIILLVTTFLGI